MLENVVKYAYRGESKVVFLDMESMGSEITDKKDFVTEPEIFQQFGLSFLEKKLFANMLYI